jgi:uncharacterized protein (TIRG00374 family)
MGMCFFCYLIADFGIANIVANLKMTGWYFVPIIGVWLFVYLLNTAAWQRIINDPKISFREIFSLTVSGFALNYVTPFFQLGGEPYKVLALKEKLGLNRSVAVTLSYLMLHFLSSFLMWITAVIIILICVPLSPIVFAALAASLVVFGIVVFAFMQGYKKGFTKSFMSFIIKMPLPKKLGKNIKSKEEFLAEVDENLKELLLKRKKDFILANIYEYMSRVVCTLEIFFILKAIGLAPTVLDSFIINAGSGLISNLLFFVPFELGVKEGGLYAVLGFMKFVPATGIYVGIVNRLRELFWILIGLVMMFMSNNKIKNKEGKDILYDEESAII